MPFVTYKAIGVGKIVTTIEDNDGTDEHVYVASTATPILPEGAPEPTAPLPDNPMVFLAAAKKDKLLNVAKAIRDQAVATIVP